MLASIVVYSTIVTAVAIGVGLAWTAQSGVGE